MIRFVADLGIVQAKVTIADGKVLTFISEHFDEAAFTEPEVLAELVCQALNRSFEEFLQETKGGDSLEVQRCRVCGCTEHNPCTRPGGETCHWVTKYLCSFCEEKLNESKKKSEPEKPKKSMALEPRADGEVEENLRERLERTGRMPKARNKEAVLALSAEMYGVQGKQILDKRAPTGRTNLGTAQRMVAYLCCTVLKMSQKETAAFLRKSYVSIYKKLKTIKRKLHDKDKRTKAAVNELTDILMDLPGEEQP